MSICPQLGDDRSGSILEMLRRAARRFPGRPAIVCGDETLSYADLEGRSGALASRLRELGVGRERMVGVLLERSADAVVAALAVLKAGGVYVPLDPAYPTERLKFMVGDSGTTILIARPWQAERLAAVPVVLLDPHDSADAAPEAEEDGYPAVDDDQAAYLIYTSGSAGRPKGVVVEHGSFALHIAAVMRDHALVPQDRVVHVLSLGFDASLGPMFAALCSGAALSVWPAQPQTPKDFLARCERERITIVEIPTAYFTAIAAELDSLPLAAPELRLVIAGGERMPYDAALAWLRFAPRARLVNVYGPTEATIVATRFVITAQPDETTAREREIPIGTALDCSLYVLDRERNPLPPGLPGELYISGRRVARGYLGRPELTDRVFLPDPFSREGARMYRTGDLVRRRTDGNLVFLGRVDDQVKIDGYRVEPGEIEAVLREHPALKRGSCAVVLAGPPEQRSLVAYVCGSVGDDPAAELRPLLEARLPAPMIPDAFVRLAALPLTVNGKIDRAALARRDPVPDAGETGPPDTADALVRELAGIFENILRRRGVGAHDRFFDLGGRSITALRVIGRVRQRYGITLTFREFFEAQSPGELAERIRINRSAPALARLGELTAQVTESFSAADVAPADADAIDHGPLGPTPAPF